MANKLTDLTVEKIAFVDEGDNPEADILIFKNKPAELQTEGDSGNNEDSVLKRLAAALAKVLGLSDNIEKKDVGCKKINTEDKAELDGDNPEDDLDEEELEIPDEDENKSAKKDTDKSKQKESCAKKHGAKEGDFTDMSKIDVSKLTPEEQAQLEAIKKKALIDDKPDDKDPDNIEKGTGGRETSGTDDIYKGVHPAVRDELEALKKFRSEAEEKELLAVAKRYEIIGKKPEELVKTFKSLKAAGGTAYDEMIAILDSTVEAVTGAGVFGEIGKRGGTGTADGSEKAWAQLEKHAEEIIKHKPELTMAQAIDEASIQHPELVHEYEANI